MIGYGAVDRVLPTPDSGTGGRSAPLIAVAVLVVSVIASGLSVSIGSRAQAAFPGRNGRIAFSVGHPPSLGAAGYFDFDIFTVTPDGRGVRQITQGPGWDLSPEWSPTGAMLLFTRMPAPLMAADIYAAHADGSEVVNLTSSPYEDEVYPSWSPDGSRIVFSSALAARYYAVGNPTLDYTFDIFVMDANGGERVRLTDDPGDELGAKWSPNGSWIAYIDLSRRVIVLMNPSGSSRRELTPPGRETPGWIDWSPDSKRLVVSTDNRLYVVNADGTGWQDLTRRIGWHVIWPEWSPNGKKIAFVANPGGRYGIYTMNADGSRVVKLIALTLLEGGGAPIDWGPHPR